MTGPNQLPTHKKNNLDFMRLLFAVAVIYSHAYPLTQATDVNEPLNKITYNIFSFGNTAVAFFFITSGYLITASWLRRQQVGDFVKRRCLRIFPGLLVALVISICVVAPIGAAPGVVPWRALLHAAALMNPLYAKGIFSHNPYPDALNASIWTIRYELWCYLLLMLLGLVGVLRRPRLALGIFAFSLVMGLFFDHLVKWDFALPGFGYSKYWEVFLPYFLSGCVTYLYRDHIPRRFWILLVGFVVCTVTLLLFHAHQTVPRGVFTVVAAYGIFYVGFDERLPFHNFGRFGDFSYGTYIYAFPIQQLIVLKMQGLTPIQLTLISTPLSLGAGILSWYLVERHFIRRNRMVPAVAPAPQPAAVVT